MAVTRLYTPRPYDSFDPGISGVAPILSTGTDVDNTKLASVQAAATAAGLGTLPTSSGGTAPSPTSAPLRFRGAWQANTAYQYGDTVLVVDGSGNTLAYSANLNFTSGSSFNSANWTELTYPTNAASGAVPVTTVGTAGSSQTITAPTHGGARYKLTASAASCALTFTGGTAGEECLVTLDLIQDGTGGRAWTFGSNVRFPEQAQPTLSTAANARDIIVATTIDGGTTFDATVVGRGFAVPQPPSQVTGLTVTPGSTQNALAWSAPASNGAVITAYKVYRSTTSGAETLLTTLGNVLSYTDTGLTNGTTYYYKVSAVNIVGEGTQSAEGSGTPAPGAAQYLSTLSGGTAYAPASGSVLSLTGDKLDIRVKCALSNWAPSSNAELAASMHNSSASGQAFGFFVGSGGNLHLQWDDAGYRQADSTAGTGFSANSTNWVRATAVRSGGTTTVSFYTSSDGSSWTQLGTSVTQVASAGFKVPTVPLALGANIDSSGGTINSPAAGKFYRAEFRLDAAASPTIVVDIPTQANSGATTWTDSASDTWTVRSPASLV